MTPEKANCFKCAFFTVTWNPTFPRACKLYGFQSASLPSVEVLKASGEECAGFEKKEKGNNNGLR